MASPLKVVSSSERVLPANLEAERAVIGAVLLRQELLADVSELRVDDFFLPAHREIWQVIDDMVRADRQVDTIALTDELRVRGSIPRLEGGEGYLFDCINTVVVAENAGHYAAIVRKKSTLRRAIELGSRIISRAYQADDPDDVLTEARDGIAELELGGAVAPVKVADAMTPVIETLEQKAQHPEKYAVMTGVRRFDRAIGGLTPENLIIVAAPPGMGKSAWASTVLVNAAGVGVPSLLISVEMSRQELIERMLAGQAKISTRSFTTGEVARDAQAWRQSVFPAARALAKLPLWVDDREHLTIGQTVGTIRRWYARHLGSVPPKHEPPKPALVAVDYLQLLASDEQSDDDDRNRAIGRMTRALKRLAGALRIPVVVLSQLSRAWDKGQSRKPKLSDLRDSGSIEQDSDVVIFPWREPAPGKDGNEIRNTSGEAEWLVGKNRHGPTGAIGVYWHAEYTRFENLDPSDDEPRLPYSD